MFFQYFSDYNLNILILYNIEAPLLCFYCIFLVFLNVKKQYLFGIYFICYVQFNLCFIDLLCLVFACYVFHLDKSIAIGDKYRTVGE